MLMQVSGLVSDRPHFVSAEESLRGHRVSHALASTQRGETYVAPNGARFLLRYVDSHNQIVFGQVRVVK